MADHDIQNSHHLLKRLEEEMLFLRSLMSQAEVVSSNLRGTWTAISVTHSNWKRDLKKDAFEK